MVDELKKAFLLGLGVLSYSEQKYNEMLEDFMKQGESKQKEGEEFVKEAKEKFEENRKVFEEKVQSEMKKLIDNLGLADKKDLEKLKKEITTLKKKVKVLENKTAKSEGGK